MSLDEEDKIKAVFMLEILGRPPEHITETLKDIIENRMKKEKGVVVKNYKINEPVLIKDQKDLYTNFAEIEIEFENTLALLFMSFAYMPAHIEIMHPEKLKITNNELSSIVNELTRKLHGYEEIVRIVQAEKNILEKKLKSILKDKDENKKEEKK